MTIKILNHARFMIGSKSQFGGGFQVGNTKEVRDGSVKFELVLDGIKAALKIIVKDFLDWMPYH